MPTTELAGEGAGGRGQPASATNPRRASSGAVTNPGAAISISRGCGRSCRSTVMLRLSGRCALADIVAHHRVPAEILEPAFDRTGPLGLRPARRRQLWLTPSGAAGSELTLATRSPIGSPTRSPAHRRSRVDRDRMQVQGALERIARGVLLQRDWTGEETRPLHIGGPTPRASQATVRMPAESSRELAAAPTRPFRAHATFPHQNPPRLQRRQADSPR